MIRNGVVLFLAMVLSIGCGGSKKKTASDVSADASALPNTNNGNLGNLNPGNTGGNTGANANSPAANIPAYNSTPQPTTLKDPSGVMSFTTLRSDKTPDSSSTGQGVVLDNQQDELVFNFYNISRSCKNNIGANYEQDGLSLVVNIVEQPSSQAVECDTTIYSNQKIAIKKGIYTGAQYINISVIDNKGATILDLQDFDLTALGSYNGSAPTAGASDATGDASAVTDPSADVGDVSDVSESSETVPQNFGGG